MSQLYPLPALDPKTLSRQVWDVTTARAIPGVGRALDLICGLISQMELDDFRGITPLPRPRLLDNPDLDLVRSTFTAVQVEDYLVHGNAAHLVTARDRSGWPAAVKWYPAHAWGIGPKPGEWYLHGREVDPDDVVHVQNGADPMNPRRGIGVVERYVRSLDRVALQEAAERENLLGGGVPSAAVIAPQKTLTQGEVDEAAEAWMDKFSGPGRRPAILPAGSEVVTLSWSPADGEMTKARQASLIDVANMFNLDGYWLGAPSSSHTYKSPGPMFLVMLRTTLERILAPFEDTWSLRWLPYGRRVTFDRSKVLGDDMATTIATLIQATGRPVMTTNEARTRLRLAPVEGGDELATTPAPAPAPEPEDPDTEQDPGVDPADQED